VGLINDVSRHICDCTEIVSDRAMRSVSAMEPFQRLRMHGNLGGGGERDSGDLFRGRSRYRSDFCGARALIKLSMTVFEQRSINCEVSESRR